MDSERVLSGMAPLEGFHCVPCKSRGKRRQASFENLPFWAVGVWLSETITPIRFAVGVMGRRPGLRAELKGVTRVSDGPANRTANGEGLNPFTAGRRSVHDAKIIGSMIENGITKLATLDKDFQGIPIIELLKTEK
ncbi:PIN domain-containing protein [Thermococcus thioreducens]|uniref:PIN domain-containing protein n=1 Tax=Thermococcus thioreducens TaxID=277988 RepID=A0A1I0Q1G6_9EURY|nr:hypothetical protein [Thermococcus thioreducens]SEW20372.1 hypothetical protein SAMN05216170_2064 [Thermococcus thioreducens]